MRDVLNELERLTRQARTMLVVQRGAVVLAWVLGVALVLVLLDFFVRLPSGFRLVLLVGGLLALAMAVARYLGAAIGFRPTLTQVALRVERSLPALSGRLASSVEFAMAGTDEGNPLAARSVREAQRRLEGESVRRIIQPGRTLRGAGALSVVVAVVAGLVLVDAEAARIGVMRLLLPYGATQWPARTAVASLMDDVLGPVAVHPRGQALPLRARNMTPGEGAGRVDVRYRLMRDGSYDGWELAVLTHQGDGVHERLVDTNAERIELYFETEDARTPAMRVELVPPPAVVRATLAVEPPAYAENRIASLQADLGPGLDDRAATESPVLVGSRARLAFELNKPLPNPDDDDARAGGRAAWIAATFGWGADDGAGVPEFAADAGRWTLSWTVGATRTLALTLEDEYGLTNEEPIEYRIEAVADLPPTVTITEPPRDDLVLPSAVIPVAGEAKDDVAVSHLALAAHVERTGAGAESAETGDGATRAAEPLDFSAERTADAGTARVEASLDLSAFDLREGDVVLLTAIAADNRGAPDASAHQSVTSPVRRLRILSELDYAAQLRRQLSAVRQNAIRMEAQQAELQDDLAEHGPQPGIERAQAQIGDRIAAQREMLAELRADMERNRLDDAQLAELLQQSADLLEYAGRAANRAVEAIEQRRAETRDEEVAPDEADRPIDEAQQEVRDELADLIELLDRDEDTWVVQRQLEGLIDEQLRLEADTAALAQETIGKDVEHLTPPQLSEMERIARRQRDLRDQARRLIEEMRRRAAALDEIDPQSASGMRTAADTGERLEVDRDMETAANRAEQNQLQSAGAAQQSASRKLDRMLEDLQETKRARAEELLRQLASLLESIDRLIAYQENELIALAGATERDDFSGRDRAMIRLTQNTQSVAAEARAAGQQSRRIARTLDRAADAQGAAVAALRARPVEAPGAHEAEERSLAMLKEARELTAELQESTEQEQLQEQREQLIEAYRVLAERQVVIRAETLDLSTGEELSRRQLVEARRLGNAQQEIRNGLGDLEAQTREILESEVFTYVHRLAEGWSDEVSDALWEGRVDVNVTDRQQMIADTIARQIEALEEALVPPDEFADDRQSNQGGGGGDGPQPPPPLIPPVAEVKRLHGLQEQVYNQTREIDRRDDLPAGQRRQRIRELGEMQRRLIELGEGMLEKLQSGAPPPVAPPADPADDDGADEPAPPPEDDPGDPGP
jgi:hypothetical protein